MDSIIISLAPMGFFFVIKLLPWMKDYEKGFYTTLLGQIVLLVVIGGLRSRVLFKPAFEELEKAHWVSSPSSSSY